MTTDSLATAPPADLLSAPKAGRLIGALGLIMLVTIVADLGDSPMFTDASNAEVLGWVHHHVTTLYVSGLVEFLGMLLNAAFLAALAVRARVPGAVAAAMWGLIGTSLAIDAVNTGAQYALAKSTERGAGPDALLALFGFVEQLTFTDGITWGLVIAVVSVASLRARTLARPVCWLGLLVAVVHLLGVPVQLAWTHTPQGATGPVGTSLLLLWWLAVSLTLLVRPGDATERDQRTRATT